MRKRRNWRKSYQKCKYNIIQEGRIVSIGSYFLIQYNIQLVYMSDYTDKEIEEMEREMARLAIIIAEHHKSKPQKKRRRRRRRGWGCLGGGVDTTP